MREEDRGTYRKVDETEDKDRGDTEDEDDTGIAGGPVSLLLEALAFNVLALSLDEGGELFE
jgi:hypothetical protein